MNHSFTEYIIDRFGDEIIDEMDAYIDQGINTVNLKNLDLKDIAAGRKERPVLTNVKVRQSPDSKLSFQVNAKMNCQLKLKDGRIENKQPWVSAECTGDLANNLDDFRIVEITPYKPLDCPTTKDNLVPFIVDLENEAESFLEQWYPEALRSPMAINTAELARRMGLTIEQHILSNNKSIFGAIVFEDTKFKVYDNGRKAEPISVEAGTILVDPFTYFDRCLGSVHNTIVHECIHWYYHRNAYLFSKMLNDPKPMFRTQTSIIDSIRPKYEDDMVKDIEYQARNIAPCVLVPQDQLKNMAIHFHKEHVGSSSKQLIEVIEDIITDLAVFFSCSKESMKLRLIKTGCCEEARGVFNYVNGIRVPTHSWRKGYLAWNERFHISPEELMIAALHNQNFKEALQDGSLIYDSGLVVRNDRNNILLGAFSGITEFYGFSSRALHHMDETAIKFSAIESTSQNEENQDETQRGSFKRSANGIKYKRFGLLEDIDARVIDPNLSKRFHEASQEYKALVYESCGASLKRLFKKIKMTHENVAEEAGVSVSTIDRIVQKRTCPPFYTLASICIACDFPEAVSRELLELAGHSCNPINPKRELVLGFLTNICDYSVQDCNEVLRRNGFSSLSENDKAVE